MKAMLHLALVSIIATACTPRSKSAASAVNDAEPGAAPAAAAESLGALVNAVDRTAISRTPDFWSCQFYKDNADQSRVANVQVSLTKLDEQRFQLWTHVYLTLRDRNIIEMQQEPYGAPAAKRGPILFHRGNNIFVSGDGAQSLHVFDSYVSEWEGTNRIDLTTTVGLYTDKSLGFDQLSMGCNANGEE